MRTIVKTSLTRSRKRRRGPIPPSWIELLSDSLMSDRQTDQDVTGLLQQWQAGDAEAMERLLPLVYNELRRVARARLRDERAGHTLQATALVHEAYLRLMGHRTPTPHNRTHLFAMAARLMREILVDHARRKAAHKRGGTATVITLDESIAAPEIATVDLLALDEALTELHALDPRLCRVVELKFFAGLNIDEVAHALDVSTATVERDWTVSRAWLHQRLSS
jgi:RNA polymerase sigma factor (TIGR02999 family)